ncbi:MAG: Protein translocase subunit SecF [Parcubacteria group bacterium GW2011_GWA1_42_7]|nr:MAG: Protein translocase subunit SecF [Parcubacteria group bacterium GW2011_GWA1_42_7]
MINIVGKRKIYYSFSISLAVLSLIAILAWGLNFGIDFTGGSLMEIEFAGETPQADAIKEKLASVGITESTAQPAGEKGFLIRFKDIDEDTHQKILASLNSLSPVEEKSFESVGPVIGQELKDRAYSAVGLVLVLILVYIAFAFRKVSRLITSWKYGVAALLALFHDILIPTGIFAVLGHFAGAQADLLFVTGLLTILGFSVHDTIVVFDRIRENLRKGAGSNFEDTVNISVNQTLARSINTSFTTLLALFAIYIWGGESIKSFILLLIMGIFFGTYSSIFVASSILVTWENWRRKKLANKFS